mgnify:CR=1 FL=1
MVSSRTTLHAAAGLAALSLFALPSEVSARDRFITVASTTSILPKFDAASGIEVRVIAVGTGAAIKLAEDGNADVLFVHHRPSEMAFVADGFGVKRFDVMYNDFILVGPQSDPAGIHDGTNLALALKKIAATKAPFTSRAGGSGTHKMELSLWVAADIATLNTASAMEAYTLTDRGTWIKFGNKGPLIIKVEGDPRLFNPYGVILVNPQRHPHTKAADGQRFIDWLLSKTGQKIIAEYRIDGKLAFFSNAESPRNAF